MYSLVQHSLEIDREMSSKMLHSVVLRTNVYFYDSSSFRLSTLFVSYDDMCLTMSSCCTLRIVNRNGLCRQTLATNGYQGNEVRRIVVSYCSCENFEFKPTAEHALVIDIKMWLYTSLVIDSQLPKASNAQSLPSIIYSHTFIFCICSKTHSQFYRLTFPKTFSV